LVDEKLNQCYIMRLVPALSPFPKGNEMYKPKISEPDDSLWCDSVALRIAKSFGKKEGLRFAVIPGLLATLFCFSPTNAKAQVFFC
jgi:hypothetical protein